MAYLEWDSAVKLAIATFLLLCAAALPTLPGTGEMQARFSDTGDQPSSVPAAKSVGAQITLLDQTLYAPIVLRRADLSSPDLPAPSTATPTATPTPTPSPAPTSTPEVSPTATATPAISDYSAQLVTTSAPSQMLPGAEATAYVDLKNTGTATWYKTGTDAVVLGTSAKGRISAFFTQGDWIDVSTPSSLEHYQVETGEVGRFEFTLTGPNLPGTSFTECFTPRMLGRYGTAWSQPGDICFEIEVMAPPATSTPKATPTPPGIAPTVQPTPTPTAQPRPTPISSIGAWVYPTNFLRGYSSMVDMGAKWVRVPVVWKNIEPSNTIPSQYSWQMYDSIFGQAASAGIEVIGTITENPSWAATYTYGPIDKVDKSEYAEFVRAVVNRYKDSPYNVRYWEIYNEPDNTRTAICEEPESGIACWGNDPGGYVELLATSYAAIRGEDPQAKVMLGGLAMDWFTDENGPFARDFLDQVLARGGGQYFDVVSFHYFPVYSWRWSSPNAKDVIGKAASIRQVLAKYGLSKELLASEVGMWSDDRMGGNEHVQAEYLPKVFSRGMAAGLTATVWFMLLDDASWYAKHGLLNPDLSPKPAFYAFKTFTAQLQDMHYEKPLSCLGTCGQLEGYSFVNPSGTRVIVVWNNSDTITGLSVAGNQVWSVSLYGAVKEYGDAGDGIEDSKVSVPVGPSPVYLEIVK